MEKYLEMIKNDENIISFSYNCGRGAFSLDLNNASEMFTISDFKRFFTIAEESAEGVFTIAEKVFSFVSCRLEYEKTFHNYSKNQKLIDRLQKITLFLSDSFGFSCDIEKPEKITKKRGTGLLFNVNACGERYAEAVTGDFVKVGGIWYFIHKKPEAKRGGYVLSAAAYGCRVAAFGSFSSVKSAVEWIIEKGISQNLRKVDAAGRARAAEMRARFLEAVENSGLSWVIESNPAYFEDFLTTAEAETPAERTEKPQNATESTTEAECTTEAEKTAEKAENAPTECATPAEDAAEITTAEAAQPAEDITAADVPTITATAPTGCTTAAGNATARRAARIARTTRHKPHIQPKTPRGYISTIDGTKALKRAKYTPTGESPGKPVCNRFSKNGNPGARNGTFETSRKICGYFEKIRVGFHIGLSPPGGYQKISL